MRLSEVRARKKRNTQTVIRLMRHLRAQSHPVIFQKEIKNVLLFERRHTNDETS